MARDDDFTLWLGRIGTDKPLRHRMRAAANRAGRLGGGKRRPFSGERIGRGGGVGRVLSARGAGHRRVMVKTRIVRLGAKGLAGAKAHLRYLQRDGTTRDGERGALYGRDQDAVDGRAFLERGAGDRHQFRFIVSPEDGDQYPDLKPVVRRLMEQAENDLGTKLDWVAVDHFNTGHPHAHIILRGKDDRGADLVIARDYLTQGLRERAAEIVSIDLGPRSEREVRESRQREVGQERLTSIDRQLIRSADDQHVVRAVHRDPVEQSLRAGRLQTLGRLGLAREIGGGAWKLEPDLETTLRRMGERDDIIRTMQRALGRHAPERQVQDQAIHDPVRDGPIIGRLIERGLSDEHADRHYLIVDGTDGRSHYVDIGIDSQSLPDNGIVRVSARPTGVRAVDVTIAEVATAHQGQYTIDDHLRHDPRASERFAEMHVRRLEAMRRANAGVTREPDGSWIIAPDHLDRVRDYEQTLASARPVVIETVSTRPLDQLPDHDGATWLDRELSQDGLRCTERGFGAEVVKAMQRRVQWLIAENLAVVTEGKDLRFRPNLVGILQQREIQRVSAQLGKELGLEYVPARKGELIEGKVSRAIQLGEDKFTLLTKSREFTLVPWESVHEQTLGKRISGSISREGHIDWTIGRSRGPSMWQ